MVRAAADSELGMQPLAWWRAGSLWALGLFLLLAHPLAAAVPGAPVFRVALMDFSTDDNSWRNAQGAAEFTSLLQLQLANEPGLEWVERAQLALARQELKLSEMELLSGAAPIRRGKWAKANWLLTGQFSLSDRNERTLALEITDLQHADVLASQTVQFPGWTNALLQPLPAQVEVAAGAVRQLLAEARQRQKATEDQVLVAPLFLADVNPFGFSGDDVSLEREFFEALEQSATTNRHLRFIHFPKAYRSMEESEMVLDGLVEADRQAWQQTADLYVWGTYAVTNARVNGTSRSTLELNLHVWDGASPPRIFRQRAPVAFGRELPAEVKRAMVERMVGQVLAQARKRGGPMASATSRREIAESIGRAYLQLSGPTHSSLGLDEEARFAQAVHMLETACFFDPDNANLHTMRMSCRWGWWMSFGSKVKNSFWSHWRQSQAWGQYVDRFGLEPTATPLPFPYEEQGISGLYVGSLAKVLEMFPERFDPEEAQQPGHYSFLRAAQAHGFPKDIPGEVVVQWKAEVEAELAARKKRADEFARATAARATNSIAASVTNPGASFTRTASAPGTKIARPTQTPPPARPTVGVPPGQQRVAPPAWYKDIQPQMSWFALAPPAVLPAALKPAFQSVPFPSQFEVCAVPQMAFYGGKLLLLALDERSAPSSDTTADLSAELLQQRGRLWSLELEGSSPVLFEPTLLPGTIHRFVLDQERLWLAGDSVGCLDLKTRTFRSFDSRAGLEAQSFPALAMAGGQLFAVGEGFKLFKLDQEAARWQRLKLPPAALASGSGNPEQLAGNPQCLAYVAGSALFYDLAAATWTTAAELEKAHCLVADESGFWFGGRGGVERRDNHGRVVTDWHSPASIPGLRAWNWGGYHYQYGGAAAVPEEVVANMDKGIQRFLETLQKERAQRPLEQSRQKQALDPLHLDWRLPGDITALANDGDFLWLATGMYSDASLLLVHKPSGSLVGHCRVPGKVCSLAVSEQEVWLGLAYSDPLLVRMRKQELLGVPRSQWLSLAISPEDRVRLVNQMSPRDRAMYAFYTGNEAQVAEVLGNVSPERASLEEMFLLAFAYDTNGLNNPELARSWFERIGTRYPESPWATAARNFQDANQQAYQAAQREAVWRAKYDRNHNGVLDPAERAALAADPGYQREQQAGRAEQLEVQVQAILKRYDRNGDSRLDPEELQALRNAVLLYVEAPPAVSGRGKSLLAPLLTKRFPSVEKILKTYGAQQAGGLDAAGLKALALDLGRER
jgi:hypothetical protein